MPSLGTCALHGLVTETREVLRMAAGLQHGDSLPGGPGAPATRAQKNGEDGEESSRTEPNLMDSLVPKQRIKQMDRQKDRETDSQIQTVRYRQSDSQKIDRKAHGQTVI